MLELDKSRVKPASGVSLRRVDPADTDGVGTIIANALRGLDLHGPTLGPGRSQALVEVRRVPMAEGRRR